MIREGIFKKARLLFLVGIVLALILQFKTNKAPQGNSTNPLESYSVRTHRVDSAHGMPWKMRQDESKPHNFGY